MINGRTALDLVASGNEASILSLLILEKSLYPDMHNAVVRNGRLPAGIADVVKLESLGAEYGLDVKEAAMQDLDSLYTRNDMTEVVESGNMLQEQLLARLLVLEGFEHMEEQRMEKVCFMYQPREVHQVGTQIIRMPGGGLLEEKKNAAVTIRRGGRASRQASFHGDHWNHGNAAYDNEAKPCVQDFASESHIRFDGL
jgi:hypothetical protein